MNDPQDFSFSRRRVLQAGMAAGVAASLGSSLATAASAPAKPGVLMRAIPSTGEKIPAVGVGTNAYGVTSAEELAELRKVLQAMTEPVPEQEIELAPETIARARKAIDAMLNIGRAERVK